MPRNKADQEDGKDLINANFDRVMAATKICLDYYVYNGLRTDKESQKRVENSDPKGLTKRLIGLLTDVALYSMSLNEKDVRAEMNRICEEVIDKPRYDDWKRTRPYWVRLEGVQEIKDAVPFKGWDATTGTANLIEFFDSCYRDLIEGYTRNIFCVQWQRLINKGKLNQKWLVNVSGFELQEVMVVALTLYIMVLSGSIYKYINDGYLVVLNRDSFAKMCGLQELPEFSPGNVYIYGNLGFKIDAVPYKEKCPDSVRIISKVEGMTGIWVYQIGG